jgi:hypothetical protein
MRKPILLATALLTLTAVISLFEARPAASAQSYCSYRHSLCLARCQGRPRYCVRRCQGQYRACKLGKPYMGDLI